MDEEKVIEKTEQPKKKEKKFQTFGIGYRGPIVREYKACLRKVYGDVTKDNEEFDIVASIYTKKVQERNVLPITGMVDEETFKVVKAMAMSLN